MSQSSGLRYRASPAGEKNQAESRRRGEICLTMRSMVSTDFFGLLTLIFFDGFVFFPPIFFGFFDQYFSQVTGARNTKYSNEWLEVSISLKDFSNSSLHGTHLRIP